MKLKKTLQALVMTFAVSSNAAYAADAAAWGVFFDTLASELQKNAAQQEAQRLELVRQQKQRDLEAQRIEAQRQQQEAQRIEAVRLEGERKQQEAQRQIDSAREAKENQKRDAERQASDKAFEKSLGKLNAGQLYTKADEMSAQGDKSKARVALRTLVSRFPNHPLAATAAQQMIAMKNSDANAANNTSGGQVSPSGNTQTAKTGSGSASSSTGRAVDENMGNVCSGQVPSFIAEKWGRFTRPEMRKMYSDTVIPFGAQEKQSLSGGGTKAELITYLEIDKIPNWKTSMRVAADNYCKVQAGCSDSDKLMQTWPQALSADLPNASGPSMSESMTGAYVAAGLGADYFTAFKKYLQCSP